jgi:hypothetical protein
MTLDERALLIHVALLVIGKPTGKEAELFQKLLFTVSGRQSNEVGSGQELITLFRALQASPTEPHPATQEGSP